jgi:ABC-type multidrug transport system fused ATPase/permease subunit
MLEHDTDGEPLGTTSGVLRRGLAASPALRKGIGFTLGMALVVALGRILIPIMIQQTLQRGVLGPSGYRPGTVAALSAVTVLALIVVGALNRATYLRLVNAAETTLYELRCRVFDHVHRLSIGTQNESFRGVLVSRVTSDIETLAQFAQWGAISWIVNLTLVAATLVAIAVYSWQLCLVVVVISEWCNGFRFRPTTKSEMQSAGHSRKSPKPSWVRQSFVPTVSVAVRKGRFIERFGGNTGHRCERPGTSP